jgi:hypothetical protein
MFTYRKNNRFQKKSVGQNTNVARNGPEPLRKYSERYKIMDMDFTINKKRLQFKNTKLTVSLGYISLGINEGGKGGGVWITFHNEKKKPFHDSRVLKKQFHGKLDSNKIIL